MKAGTKIRLIEQPSAADILEIIKNDCEVPVLGVPYTVQSVSEKGNIKIKELESQGKFWKRERFEVIDPLFVELFTGAVKRCRETLDIPVKMPRNFRLDAEF